MIRRTWRSFVGLLKLVASTSALVLFLSSLLCAMQDSSAVQQAEGQYRERAAELIRQLANPDFELRQQASRALWQMGAPVLELLQKTADNGSNSEARMRAKDIATLIRVGVKHDDNAEIVRCVTGFLDREILVQSRAIRKLCLLQRRDVAQKLIELVPSESDRRNLREQCSMAASDAEVALRLGDDARFKEWIEDPATRQSQKFLYYYYLWIDDRLDAEIEQLKEKALAEIEAVEAFREQQKTHSNNKQRARRGQRVGNGSAESPEQPNLRTLIGLLRFTEQWNDALSFADKVENLRARRDLMHSILMESGNWKRLAELIVAKEVDAENLSRSKTPHDALAYTAKGYRKALVHFYAGNEGAFEATIGEIESAIDEEQRKKKQQGFNDSGGNPTHAQFLRYTLDFDRALKYTSLKKDNKTFQMLSRYRRYEKLLDVFGLETYKKRARFFKGRLRHIRSLQNRVDYYTELDNENQRDTYADKRDTEIRNWREVVQLLDTLGFDAEAELYSRQLYFEFSDRNSSIAFGVVYDLQSMGARDSAWEIVELEIGRTRSADFRGTLLNPGGYDHDAATFLDNQLKKSIEDPIKRYRKIAALIKSPMDQSEDEIDFWSEIKGIDLSRELQAIRHLFLIWNIDAERLFTQADNFDGNELLEQLIKNGDYLLAAQKYEAKALAEGYLIHYAQAWHAYLKGGDKTKARQMRLLYALKFDPEDAYDYTSGYAGTQWQSLPFDLYRLYDSLENDEAGEYCYYAWKIAEDDKESVLSAHQKMVRTQILRLKYIDSPYFEDSEKDHPLFIEGCLERGDLAGARRWFKRLSTFQPADSGFVENNFPVFEKMESGEFVDEMLQKVSDDFYVILSVFPDSAMYLNNYAWACACSKRNVSSGIELAERAVGLRPGTAGYHDTLAELYHVAGQHEKAINTIRRAIEINPMRDYYRDQLQKFVEAKAAAKK